MVDKAKDLAELLESAEPGREYALGNGLYMTPVSPEAVEAFRKEYNRDFKKLQEISDARIRKALRKDRDYRVNQ